MQSFTLRSGAPEAEVVLGDGGGTVTVVGGTVYYRDEPGVTSSVNDGSIADGASTTLFGTQFFSTAASRVDGQVRLLDVATSSAVVQALGTAGDRALIAAAIESCRVGGKLNGVVEVKGVASLTSTLDVDLGYTNVTAEDGAGGGTSWATATPNRFRLRMDCTPVAGVGVGVYVHGGYSADIDVGLFGGGQRVQVTDGAITSSQLTLTSPLSVAGGIRAGCVVEVAGAGQLVEGVRQPLAATVRSVTGNVLTLSEAAGATVSGARVRGADVGVSLGNLLNHRHDIVGKNFAGVVLHADSYDDTTKRLRSVAGGRVIGNTCGRTVFFKGIEAFGNIGSIFSNVVWGDYWGSCDDITADHYEGGIGGDPTDVAERYMWIDRCNQFNGFPISTGDRPSEAMVYINGPGSNLGRLKQVRCTAYKPAGVQTYTGLKLVGVDSVEIDTLDTANALKGLHVIGGGANGIRIKRHFSLTGDVNPVYVESGTTGVPIIDIGAHYRVPTKEAVKVVASTPGVGGGQFAGGRLTMRGYIDTPNQSGTAGIYALDIGTVAADTGLLTVDVAELTQPRRAVLAGSIQHPTPANVWNVSRAMLGNPTSLMHGVVPFNWQSAPPALPVAHTAFASGTAKQNLTGRLIYLLASFRLQPTAVGIGEVECYMGIDSTTMALYADFYDTYDTAAGGANDRVTQPMIIPWPPGHWLTFTLTRSTISKIYGQYA